jgi:signal transduction histidine kinase
VSGVAEIDAVAGALHNSSVRLVEALARERSYSAEVSHQLRTPLTRLRLGLEKARARPTTSDAALADATAEALADALAEIDQLDATIDYLAALARDRVPGGAVSEPGSVTLDAARRWSQTFEDAGRTLEATVGRDVVAVSASAGGLGQVLDVLLDNALRHGAGSVRLSAHGVAGGSAIEVSDEGTTLAAIANETLFGHRPLEGHGIGLALARAIVEAEDGRLLLVSRSPTTFSWHASWSGKMAAIRSSASMRCS